MNLERARQSFLQESAELLEEMEGILLDAEADNITAEQLGALFRAMHTIKGSAGLFGLEDIVHFTHQVEDLLDQLRDGSLQLDAELDGLLLRSHDYVKAQLAALEGGTSPSGTEQASILADIAAVMQHANKHLLYASGEHLAPPPTQQPTSEWLLSLRFGPDVLRNGMDPASFIRYLETLGEIQAIASCCPELARQADEDSFDPERNYLRVEVQFCGAVEAAQLHSVFAFASEDGQFIISPRQQLDSHLQQALSAGDAVEQQAASEIWQQWGLWQPPVACPPESGPSVSLPPSATPVEQAKTGKSSESRFIKVEAAKLDQLINLVGELVIAGASSNLLARQHGNAPLLESTTVLAGLIEQIRSQTLSMRMVPIGECFSRFSRVVRDVSHALGKDIRLFVSGAETELDKSMVDKLTDPLTHLVRNAIDHGIEDTAQRRAAGKPEAGSLWLDAYHESGSVVIEVADDGRGLHQPTILEKARQRGLLSADRELPEQDIYRLIFEPGFSTAAAISNLSGRGVGLDVVKQNIAQLRGTIEVESEAGLGSTFRLRLPLTLAIIDGFLVTVGRATFVIPLDCIAECISLPQDWESTAAAGYFKLREEMLPLLCLRRFLGLEDQPARRQNVVIIQTGDYKVGLLVDALHGEFQTVIKPLSPLFQHLEAISGSTILGSGEVALILDVLALSEHARSMEYALHQPTGLSSPPSTLLSAGKTT